MLLPYQTPFRGVVTSPWRWRTILRKLGIPPHLYKVASLPRISQH